jgi:transcriptional regulator with XRE-family HTH domain
MAEASPEITVTPKQLGKHLRTVRRKKGLSLSEVARGAGLSRRELVAYERGKIPIPENDLWVLAGSCGVDVAELVPETSSRELVVAAGSTTVGDTVTQLRKSQADVGLAPYLHTLHKLQALPPGKRVPVKERELNTIADALGREPAAIERRLQEVLQVSPDEAARLRAMILAPPSGRGAPRALAASTPAMSAPAPAPAAAMTAATPAMPAFSEPLSTSPVAPAAFLDAPRDAPVDATNGHNVDVFAELARLPEPVPLGDPAAPVPDLLAPQDPFAGLPLVVVPATGPPEGTVELVDPVPAAGGYSSGASTDAPDQDHAAAARSAADAPPIDVAQRQGSDVWDWGEPPVRAPEAPAPDLGPWDSEWQPPAPPGDGNGAPAGFWEATDDWAPTEGSVTATQPVEDLNPWTADEWPKELVDDGPWSHQPDPEAVNTGFYVDWGTPEADAPTAAEAVFPDTPMAPDEPVAAGTTETVGEPSPWFIDPVATVSEPEPEAEPDFVVDLGVEDVIEVHAAGEAHAPPHISWRADGPPALLPPPAAEPVTEVEVEVEVAIEVDAEPVIEQFVTAGSDWQLGNALPLVEVQGQGALVMRRADERWALADVTTAADFAVEVDVDFRSGPGLGVLFRASVDDEGRMSGYSFDIDPIYDGGGFLVRQWHADRELWNPIARVASGDPTEMHGPLTVRLVVTGEELSAVVNGIEVLTVDNLKQASTDRGREAATGNRVGVQAWSSSDLVIETLRVADH